MAASKQRNNEKKFAVSALAQGRLPSRNSIGRFVAAEVRRPTLAFFRDFPPPHVGGYTFSGRVYLPGRESCRTQRTSTLPAEWPTSESACAAVADRATIQGREAFPDKIEAWP